MGATRWRGIAVLIPLLILALAAFAWLEFVRRRALEETPAVRPS
jgi:hypothetical protein